MRAIVIRFNRGIGNCQARTDNDIAIAFAIRDGTVLKLGDVLEVDLQGVVARQRLLRASDGKVIAGKLGAQDLHDLRLPSGHGTDRSPSPERLAGG